MPNRPDQPPTPVTEPTGPGRPKGLRAAARWQILALAAFAICFCTLAVQWQSTPTLGGKVILKPATAPGLVPFAGSAASGGDRAPLPVHYSGAIATGAPTPTNTVSVLTLVIAGASGTGGFLSGVAALITVRQGTHQMQRRQAVLFRPARLRRRRHR